MNNDPAQLTSPADPFAGSTTAPLPQPRPEPLPPVGTNTSPIPPVSQPTTTPTPPKQKEAAPPAPSGPQLSEAQIHSTAVGDAIAHEEGDVYWENYAREIELEKEIAEMGVEKVEAGEVEIPEDVAKEMGVKPTVHIQTPLASVSDFSVRGVSLSDDQLTVGKKAAPSTGFRWLVEWFIYELLKAHILVKFVKGKIGRERKADSVKYSIPDET